MINEGESEDDEDILPPSSNVEEQLVNSQDPIYSFYEFVQGNRKTMVCKTCKTTISRGEKFMDFIYTFTFLV